MPACFRGSVLYVAFRRRDVRRLYPELQNLISVPNGSKRDAATGAKLVLEGLKRGFPDLALFTPRGGYGALFVEMKKRTGGRLSEHQMVWIERLQGVIV